MEHTIDSFVDSLLSAKGVVGVPDEVVEQMKNDLVSRAEDLINAEILACIPQAALSEFEQVLDGGTDAEVQAFYSEHIKNLDEVIAQGLMKLQRLYLGTLS